MLENVRVKVEAFEYLQLPFNVREGCIGRLEIQVHHESWISLHNAIVVSRLCICRTGLQDPELMVQWWCRCPGEPCRADLWCCTCQMSGSVPAHEQRRSGRRAWLASEPRQPSRQNWQLSISSACPSLVGRGQQLAMRAAAWHPHSCPTWARCCSTGCR